MTQKLLLIGGGGHCASILDSVLKSASFDDVGIVDDNEQASKYGVPVVGNDASLENLKKQGWSHAFVSVGSVGDVTLRKNLYEMINNYGFIVPNIIDPTAAIAKNAHLEQGIYVGKMAIINTNSMIGSCSIINSRALVEHDCKIGPFSHISPGAVLLGGVTVGSNTHIGAGSVVRQGLQIGSDTLIGQCSNVICDIESNVTAYGNPCKVVAR